VKRVLLTAEATAGLWRYSLDLARGMVDAGLEPVLAVLGAPPAAERAAEAGMVAGLRIIETGLPGEAGAANEADLRATGAALAGLASRIGADTVHLHLPALAAEVPWSVPVVAFAHGDVGTWWHAVHGRSPPADLAWRTAAMARGLAEADVAVAPSRSFARTLVRLYRPGRPIEVVPYGCTRVIVPPCRRQPSVLAAARLWDGGKNLAVLDRAASRLDAPVFAAGRLEELDQAVGGFAALTCLGPLSVSALVARMAEASVFVAPSRYAPFGLTVLQAAQSGMALALADIPTFRELWAGAALFFHPDDPDSLADILSRLLERPEAAAARARRQAERYSAEVMVQATLALHRPLADQHAA
jgi:glycosyltransferase involved in cell wall biosynthesis